MRLVESVGSGCVSCDDFSFCVRGDRWRMKIPEYVCMYRRYNV